LLADGTVQPIGCAPAYGTLTQFDGIGRPAAVIEAGGATTTSQYNRQSDPRHRSQRSGQAEHGRPRRQPAGGGRRPNRPELQHTYTYDPLTT